MEKQLETENTNHKHIGLLQQLAAVFHEPEIPLKDKVTLGPIEKYVRYSK
jgi:hypothetical protein